MTGLGIKVIRAYRVTRRKNEPAYNEKSLLYFSTEKGECLYDVVQAAEKPETIYRPFVNKILTAAGLDPTIVETRWDRHAGCPCGCMPGYVLQHVPSSIDQFDIYVIIEITNDGKLTADNFWIPEIAHDIFFAQ